MIITIISIIVIMVPVMIIIITIYKDHDRPQQSPFDDEIAHHLEVDFHVNSCARTLLPTSLLLTRKYLLK